MQRRWCLPLNKRNKDIKEWLNVELDGVLGWEVFDAMANDPPSMIISLLFFVAVVSISLSLWLLLTYYNHHNHHHRHHHHNHLHHHFHLHCRRHHHWWFNIVLVVIIIICFVISLSYHHRHHFHYHDYYPFVIIIEVPRDLARSRRSFEIDRRDIIIIQFWERNLLTFNALINIKVAVIKLFIAAE